MPGLLVPAHPLSTTSTCPQRLPGDCAGCGGRLTLAQAGRAGELMPRQMGCWWTDTSWVRSLWELFYVCCRGPSVGGPQGQPAWRDRCPLPASSHPIRPLTPHWRLLRSLPKWLEWLGRRYSHSRRKEIQRKTQVWGDRWGVLCWRVTDLEIYHYHYRFLNWRVYVKIYTIFIFLRITYLL